MFTFPIYNKEMTDPLPVLVVGKKYTFYTDNLSRKLSTFSDENMYHLQYNRYARF